MPPRQSARQARWALPHSLARSALRFLPAVASALGASVPD